MQHFDMKEIERAEKQRRKAEKKARKSKSKSKSEDTCAEAAGGAFEMNTADPRFTTRLFENHEYAIDPTNPRYKGTSGMEALLEEGRKRKNKIGTVDEKSGFPKEGNGKKSSDSNVKDLVEKIKKRKA